MNKKYTVLPEPYYTDADELVGNYDLTLSAGDIVTADLTKVDSQGDVYASPVDPVNSIGDWINTECLKEVKDWQIYVPDGLTPIGGGVYGTNQDAGEPFSGGAAYILGKAQMSQDGGSTWAAAVVAAGWAMQDA